jgi:hypothetical protein
MGLRAEYPSIRADSGGSPNHFRMGLRMTGPSAYRAEGSLSTPRRDVGPLRCPTTARRWSRSGSSEAGFFTISAILAVWVPTIFFFDSVDTWQLVLNTVTSVLAFLLIALLQNSERRYDRALHPRSMPWLSHWRSSSATRPSTTMRISTRQWPSSRRRSGSRSEADRPAQASPALEAGTTPVTHVLPSPRHLSHGCGPAPPDGVESWFSARGVRCIGAQLLFLPPVRPAAAFWALFPPLPLPLS